MSQDQLTDLQKAQIAAKENADKKFSTKIHDIMEDVKTNGLYPEKPLGSPTKKLESKNEVPLLPPSVDPYILTAQDTQGNTTSMYITAIDIGSEGRPQIEYVAASLDGLMHHSTTEHPILFLGTEPSPHDDIEIQVWRDHVCRPLDRSLHLYRDISSDNYSGLRLRNIDPNGQTLLVDATRTDLPTPIVDSSPTALGDIAEGRVLDPSGQIIGRTIFQAKVTPKQMHDAALELSHAMNTEGFKTAAREQFRNKPPSRAGVMLMGAEGEIIPLYPKINSNTNTT